MLGESEQMQCSVRFFLVLKTPQNGTEIIFAFNAFMCNRTTWCVERIGGSLLQTRKSGAPKICSFLFAAFDSLPLQTAGSCSRKYMYTR